jgi:hypothetical protein
MKNAVFVFWYVFTRAIRRNIPEDGILYPCNRSSRLPYFLDSPFTDGSVVTSLKCQPAAPYP